MQPEWKKLAPGIYWCQGCGCVKIVRKNKPTKYKVPRRESERRKYGKEKS